MDFFKDQEEKQKNFKIQAGSFCPYCGADVWRISGRTTLVCGPNNTTTYHCSSCGKEWTNRDFAPNEINPR